MCTVAILAAPGGYVVGHNRDESRLRAAAVPPAPRCAGSRRYLAPTDPEGGGTWIAVNEAGLTLSLLNAAHAAPERLPARPESRGTVALGLAGAASLAEVVAGMDALRERLGELRGFHLVAVAPGPDGAPGVVRFRWTGLELSRDPFRAPCLFVSSLLHQADAERARGESWERFRARSGRPTADLAGWLASHEPARGALSPCMHRPDAVTVSRSIVTVGETGIGMTYTAGSPCDPGAVETTHVLE